MSDVKRLVQRVDEVHSPDLWSEIEGRRPRVLPPQPGPRRRVAVVLVALAVSAAGTWYAYRSFTASAPEPAVTTSTPPVLRPPVEVRLPNGSIPVSLDIGPDSAWVSTIPQGTKKGAFLRIDLGTNRVVASIPVRFPNSVQVVGDTVWVLQRNGGPRTGNLCRVDAATNHVVDTISVGGTPEAMAADADGVWVLTFAGVNPGNLPTLVRIDPTTDEIVAQIPLPDFTTRWGEVQLGGGSVWVLGAAPASGRSGDFGGALLRVDPKTNRIVGTIPVDGFDMDVDADAGVVWVESADPRDVKKFAILRVEMGTNAISSPIGPSTKWGSDLLGHDADGLWFDMGRGHITHLNAATSQLDAMSELVKVNYVGGVYDPKSRSLWELGFHVVYRIDLG